MDATFELLSGSTEKAVYSDKYKKSGSFIRNIKEIEIKIIVKETNYMKSIKS